MANRNLSPREKAALARESETCGLSHKEFAAARGIHPRTLRAWRAQYLANDAPSTVEGLRTRLLHIQRELADLLASLPDDEGGSAEEPPQTATENVNAAEDRNSVLGGGKQRAAVENDVRENQKFDWNS